MTDEGPREADHDVLKRQARLTPLPGRDNTRSRITRMMRCQDPHSPYGCNDRLMAVWNRLPLIRSIRQIRAQD